ncbi:MAG: type II toxin-antitoxin system VapC family toxin [Cyclobacteriaceae bacterium]
MVLLDTNIYLWWLDSPSKISSEARSLIEDPATTVFVSGAVPWEISVKKKIGKLEAPDDVMSFMEQERFLELSISHQHTGALQQLPDIHKDPFDRIQIAQALVENLYFITRDSNVLQYNLIKTIKG